jgi:hypothetical protein
MALDAMCGKVFLENQEKLTGEAVVETQEEAMEFLEECMAQVFNSPAEIRDYWEAMGMDAAELSDEEIIEELEVFSLPDGRYLVVEA